MTAGFMEWGYKLPDLHDKTDLPVDVERPPIDPYTSQYIMPRPVPRQAPEIQQNVHELRAWTNWTDDTLAKIIGTANLTWADLLGDRSNVLTHNEAARRRLEEAYDIVFRIYVLAGRSTGQTAAVLDQEASGSSSPKTHLIEGRPREAYLTAVQALRPPQTSGMMTSHSPIDPLTATVAVLDED